MIARLDSARAAGKVSLAVLVSRILGLVREQVFAAFFGAGLQVDAWNAAFRIPNLLRDLFAEGAFSSAFIPVFAGTLSRRGRQEAWLLVNLVISGLMVVLGSFTLLLLLFPEAFVYLMASGFGRVAGKVEVTAGLIQILSPFLILVALASVAMGVLNSFDQYFLPALAPALFNVCVILAGFLLVPVFEEKGWVPIYAMAVGAALGGLLQFGLQWPLLRRLGYRFRFRLSRSHPGIRQMLRLIGPAVVGISAVQINLLVNTQIASYLGNGPVAWLNYAFRIIYLPIGLFGVAVGMVNLREVSFQAAQQDWEDLRETVANSIKLVALLAVPSAVGLIVLAVPIVELLFERGGFSRSDTLFTAYAVMLYALGLLAYSCVKIYVPTFYALNDTRTPVRVSLASVALGVFLNLVLVVLLPSDFKYLGLAFGTAASVSLNNLLLAVRFRDRMGSLSRYRVAPHLLKCCLAAMVMGLVVWLLRIYLDGPLSSPELIPSTLGLMAVIVLGTGVYFCLTLWLGVEEVRYLFERIRRRFGGAGL